MSHAFIPPNLPGHKNTPLVLQLVANYLVGRLSVVNNENLLYPLRNKFPDFIRGKNILENWDLTQGLPFVVGVLSRTSRWLCYALKDAADLILAVHTAGGRPIHQYMRHGYASLQFPGNFSMEILRAICNVTRVVSVSYEPDLFYNQFTRRQIFLYFRFSAYDRGLEAQVERQLTAGTPRIFISNICWPEPVIECLRTQGKSSERHTWQELSTILDEHCPDWETERFIPFGNRFQYPTTFWVNTTSGRFRCDYFREFCRALQLYGCNIDELRLDGTRTLPSLFIGGKRKRE